MVPAAKYCEFHLPKKASLHHAASIVWQVDVTKRRFLRLLVGSWLVSLSSNHTRTSFRLWKIALWDLNCQVYPGQNMHSMQLNNGFGTWMRFKIKFIYRTQYRHAIESPGFAFRIVLETLLRTCREVSAAASHDTLPPQNHRLQKPDWKHDGICNHTNV